MKSFISKQECKNVRQHSLDPPLISITISWNYLNERKYPDSGFSSVFLLFFWKLVVPLFVDKYQHSSQQQHVSRHLF